MNCHERKRQRKGGLCVKCCKEKRFDDDKDLLKEGLFKRFDEDMKEQFDDDGLKEALFKEASV